MRRDIFNRFVGNMTGCAGVESGSNRVRVLLTSDVLWSGTDNHPAAVKKASAADCTVAEMGYAHLPPRQSGVHEAVRHLVCHRQAPPPRVPSALQVAISACSIDCSFAGVCFAGFRFLLAIEHGPVRAQGTHVEDHGTAT